MTPDYIIPRLALHAINLVALSVGLGKSTLSEAMIQSPLVQEQFSLVIYAAAQTRILHERVAALRPGRDTLVLRPRPRERCGGMDGEWSRMERQGCSAAARRNLCVACAENRRCPWLRQFEGLDRYRIIMGTQAYFNVASLVLLQRIRAARNALVLLDEDLILSRTFKQVIHGEELRRHHTLLRDLQAGASMSPAGNRAVEAHLRASAALLDPIRDPRDLQHVPLLPAEIAGKVQARGIERYGDDYHYLGDELFTCLLSRRFRNSGGDPVYIWRPWLGDATVVLLSAELDPAIVQHRLGREVTCVFPHRYTQHTETRIYNIRDHRFCASYLPAHLPHLVVPFAQFIKREMEGGDRVLLVTRKRFKGLVCAMLTPALTRVGAPGLRVVSHEEMTGDQGEVPLISYGLQGINKFQEYSSVICIGSYNVAPRALTDLVNDVHRPDEHLPVEIAYQGGLRTARLKGSERTPGLEDLVQRYLFQLEFNTANQAVGRVRHCTRPRTVVFCQQTELPYELEVPAFERFAGFRQHFGLETEREFQARKRAGIVAELRAQGLTQRQVAERSGLSLSTVKRRWNR